MSIIHWDDYSNPIQARNLRQYVIKELTSKAPYSETQSAIIMSRPQPQSAASLYGFIPSDPNNNAFSSSRIRDAYIFRVRFIKSANKSRAASEAIPDFESLTLTNDVVKTRNKLVNLPICVALGDHNSLKVGDQITVATRKSDIDPDVPSLQMCTMIAVENSPMLTANEQVGSTVQRSYEFLFEGTDTYLGETNFADGERSGAPVISDSITITWEQALALSTDSRFLEIGGWIKAAEGTYQSVIGQLNGWTDPVSGKRIDQMTIAEVREAQRGSIRALGRTSTAVGAYQWIRGTLDETVAYFKSTSPDIDVDSLVFNRTTQEAMAVYLLIAKRPVVGNYLLGAHDNHSEAAQAMALEWASIPVQYSIRSPLAGCNKIVRRGQSAYEGCAGNRSSSRRGHGPDDLVTLLKSTQSSFSSNGSVQEIIENNNIEPMRWLASAGDSAHEDAPTEEEELERLEALGYPS